MNETVAWESVLNRDASVDDRLLYGVTTTGIYCRPSCPSRRPKRDNVAFFSSVEAAERAGFRACQRCRPNRAKAPNTAVERARNYIDRHIADLGEERITLDLLGEESGMSPSHLQRKFKESFGLTPAQYIRARKSERLKGELKRGETVSRATFGAGYGSSSRVYEAADASLGMTPATYRRGGLGMHQETPPPCRLVVEATPAFWENTNYLSVPGRASISAGWKSGSDPDLQGSVRLTCRRSRICALT